MSRGKPKKGRPLPESTPQAAARHFDEARAQQWIETEGARELALLLMGALVCAYRLGRYGMAEGFNLSAEERHESIERVKPINLQILARINAMGDQFYG